MLKGIAPYVSGRFRATGKFFLLFASNQSVPVKGAPTSQSVKAGCKMENVRLVKRINGVMPLKGDQYD